MNLGFRRSKLSFSMKPVPEQSRRGILFSIFILIRTWKPILKQKIMSISYFASRQKREEYNW
jgi:hypothetical protein